MIYARVLFSTMLTSKRYSDKNGKCYKETGLSHHHGLPINHTEPSREQKEVQRPMCLFHSVLHIKLGENIWIIEHNRTSREIVQNVWGRIFYANDTICYGHGFQICLTINHVLLELKYTRTHYIREQAVYQPKSLI